MAASVPTAAAPATRATSDVEAFTGSSARIDDEEITLIGDKPLGSGMFGSVWKGRCRGCYVAVKVPNRRSLTQAQMAGFLSEMEIMKKIANPHCCLFMGAVVDEKARQIKIVTELCAGDMNKLVLEDKHVNYPLSQRLGWALQAARGLAWLHGLRPNPILHRDLKLANLLHDAELNVRVADFGLAQVTEGGKEVWEKNPRGSLLYMAPEVYLCNYPITDKTDVHSFAMVLWEFCTRREVYEEYYQPNVFIKDAFIGGKRPPLDEHWPQRLKDLFQQMWAPNPADRPSMASCVDELEQIVADVKRAERIDAVTRAIADPVAREFWLANYLDVDSVPVDDFMAALYARTGMPLPPKADDKSSRYTAEQVTRRCFEIMVTDASHHNAELTKFGQLIGWLRGMDAAGNAFMERLVDLMRQPWFHGLVSADDAANLLRTGQVGYFLVRYSLRAYGGFAISVIREGPAVVHWSIHLTPAGYKMEPSAPAAFATIPQLITSLSRQLDLAVPCPNTSWAYLFHTQPIAQTIGYVTDIQDRNFVDEASLFEALPP